MTRKSHIRELKVEEVFLVNGKGLSGAAATRDLVLHPSVLYRWFKVYGDCPHQTFPGLGQLRSTKAGFTTQ